jgi:hypothetical protein
MRRFTVMGFTEAELGFVIAAVFAALAVSGLSSQPSAQGLQAKTDSLTKRVDSVTRAFEAYRDSVHKKSNKTPRCSEKGESPDPIADLRVVGRNAYVLGGDTIGFKEVEQRLAPQIQRSASLGCRYLVRTIATPGVDGPDHSAAVSRLWSHFDVNERQR